MTTADLTWQDLADFEEEADEQRQAAWLAWLATDPVIDPDDEF